MTPDPIRHTAFLVLDQVASGRHTLDDVIDQAILTAHITDRRDRNFIYALSYGTLRWQGQLDWILNQVSNRPIEEINPKVRNILRLGLFQIRFMDRIPTSAAVNTSVNLSKTVVGSKVSGFVNAVLRNAIRRQDTIRLPNISRDPVASLSVRMSFAPWMISRWIKRMGVEETLAGCETINTIAPLTLRANTLKTDRQALIHSLKADGETPSAAPCSPLGIQLKQANRTIPDLAGFQTGSFQVQDEAAQLVTFLLDPKPCENILDACAGLGGKTGHIAQLMNNTGCITAADHHPEKLKRLSREMGRLGITIVSPCKVNLNKQSVVSALDCFDRVFLDAPCSGLGVLRRHPDAKWRHSAETIVKMADRQFRDALPSWRAGQAGGYDGLFGLLNRARGK